MDPQLLAESSKPKITAFISYSTIDRRHGSQAKDALAEVGVPSFLAHEDLVVSDEWRTRILEELQRCDIFVPLLSAHFRSSDWAAQEVGFIASRPEVMVVPLSIDGTTPFGFISRWQSAKITEQGITSAILTEPLAARFPRSILPPLIAKTGNAASFRLAEERMRPLVRYFPNFTAAEAQSLAELSVKNSQIWSANLCRNDYLPELVRVQGSNIKGATLRALEYQITNDDWYNAE